MQTQTGDKEETKRIREVYKKQEVITCSGCGKKEGSSEKFKQCSQCKLVRYCGSECAKKDWKKGGHKIVCKK